MNKYDSKTGVTMFLIMALLCFATVFFYILWATSGIWVPAILFSLILLLGYVPIYFFTNYELDSTYLHIRMGFFTKKIQLDKIEAVYPTKNWVFSYATSYQRIAVIYNENGKIKKVYVSPFLYAAFLNDLTDLTLDSAVLTNLATEQQPEPEAKAEEVPAQPVKKVATKKPTTKKPATKSTAKKTAGRPKTTAKKSVGRPKKKA